MLWHKLVQHCISRVRLSIFDRTFTFHCGVVDVEDLACVRLEDNAGGGLDIAAVDATSSVLGQQLCSFTTLKSGATVVIQSKQLLAVVAIRRVVEVVLC